MQERGRVGLGGEEGESAGREGKVKDGKQKAPLLSV